MNTTNKTAPTKEELSEVINSTTPRNVDETRKVTNKTAVEERVWIFIAYKGDKYGTVPYFSKLFTDHTELKIFSANHSQEEKDNKKVPNYHSTYLDLTDKSLLTQAHQQGEREGVEKTLLAVRKKANLVYEDELHVSMSDVEDVEQALHQPEPLASNKKQHQFLTHLQSGKTIEEALEAIK